MRKPDTNKATSERGAILVHVAFAVLAITAFTTFVIDYGVFWESRRQIQNAADAGALAGATALAFDDPNDKTPAGPAVQAAIQVAQSNLVWGVPPSVLPEADVFITGAGGAQEYPCPPPNSGVCIRVNAYRSLARGNALPMFFGSLVGLTQQDVQGTAAAYVGTGNSSNCIKPVAIADKWFENNPIPNSTWSPTSTFDPTGGSPDVYVPATSTSAGSGFTIANDYGTELLLKPGQPNDTINPGWFQPIRLPGNTGAADYRADWASCANIGGTFKIGDYLDKENGNMIGPTRQGVEDLLALDPAATWNYTTKEVQNSCWQTSSCVGNPNATQSPRIVALPVFDLQEYLATGGTTGNGQVRIVNILGFFVLNMVGNDVRGILMTAPGLYNSSGSSVPGPASFLVTISLIR